MLDTDAGELVEKTLEHEGERVGEFYATLPGPVLVGIEATGSMPWFLKLLEELKAEWVIQRRSARPSPASRSTIGGTRTCF
jgi:hypothetical protein